MSFKRYEVAALASRGTRSVHWGGPEGRGPHTATRNAGNWRSRGEAVSGEAVSGEAAEGGEAVSGEAAEGGEAVPWLLVFCYEKSLAMYQGGEVESGLCVAWGLSRGFGVSFRRLASLKAKPAATAKCGAGFVEATVRLVTISAWEGKGKSSGVQRGKKNKTKNNTW